MTRKCDLDLGVIILKNAKDEILRNQLWEKSKTSTTRFNRVLKVLLKNNLLEEKCENKKMCFGHRPRHALSGKPRGTRRRYYKITKKGTLFLERCKDLTEMVEHDREKLLGKM